MLLGQPPLGQNVIAVETILEFAFASDARTSVKVTYCDPAPNFGTCDPGIVAVQLIPLPEVSGYCVGRAATVPSDWVISVSRVTYTVSTEVSPFVVAVNVTVDKSVPSLSISTGFGAAALTFTNCGGGLPIMLAALGLRKELSCEIW
jgi:hypothetical protein